MATSADAAAESSTVTVISASPTAEAAPSHVSSLRSSDRSWRRAALRALLESLATPCFLHRLASGLFFYHCILLFTTLSTITLYCIIYTPSPSSFSILFLFLIFHTIKSAASLGLLILRAAYPHLWHTQRPQNEPWLSSFDTLPRQYHHAHLVSRVCFMAWMVLGTVWWFQAEDVERPAMLQCVVLGLLALEYGVVALHVTMFVQLMWIFPCSQLSFALPFIPLPQPAASSFDSVQRGLTDKQIRALPLSAYRQPHTSAEQADEAREVCAVCLSAMVDGEMVRRLRCRHCYHQCCIDEWLVRRAVCPLCVRTVAAITDRTVAEQQSHPVVEMTSAGTVSTE